MMRYFKLHIFFVLFLSAVFPLQSSFSSDGASGLIHDLLIVDYWNQRLSERLPVTYNHLLQGGYLNMPSARMGQAGEIGFGYSSVPPYRNYNLRIQLVDFLEISGNYRIYNGIEDPLLTRDGFGDMSDKGANFKLALIKPEDSSYRLPGLAIGFDDVMGTRGFKSNYIVLTQVFLDQNMELSLGYGQHRIRGWFGGFSWFPFRLSENEYLQGLSFTTEYDATPYRDPKIERHPEGREKDSPLNIGVKYRLWDFLDCSLSYVRGNTFAWSASMSYNFGETKGMPKLHTCLPYRSPVNNEEIGFLRPEDVLVHDLVFAFRDQGFTIFDMWIENSCERTLRIKIVNCLYREEKIVRERINQLVACLIPDNIDRVIVMIESDGFSIQEYCYNMSLVREYKIGEVSRYELALLTPLREASPPSFCERLIFHQDRELFGFGFIPKTHTLFGSAKGKFKYALGISFLFNGCFLNDYFYFVSLGYLPISNLYDLRDTDKLNPSQLINVRTDIINYYKQKSITIDEAYIQKVTNWGKGFYTRSAIGLFDQQYGGTGFECLYYPVNCPWAIGMEGAILKRRTESSLFSFTDKIRKLDGFKPTYRHFLGSQYFLNLYYDWKETALEFRVSMGKFLANDYGARYELSRYFPSGLRLSFWYTYTNGHDKINGQTYYDKGVGFSMPLELFYTCCSRTRWGYGMSAWLRDVGVSAFTGSDLYYLINMERQ